MSAMPAPAERTEAPPRRREGARTTSRARAHQSGTTVRRGAAPRTARRVSGPARGKAATAPRAPRRVATAGGAVALPGPTLAPRLLDVARGLPDSKWLDRLMRGQGWVVLIGIALIGIVAMQVHLLKLNAGIGRAVEHSATLERQNADLRADVSRLSAPERIQQVAGRIGLVMPAAGDVRYVKSRQGSVDARRAAKVMRAPTPPEAATAGLAAAQGGTVTEPPAGTATPPAGTAPAATATPTATAQPQQQSAPATTTPAPGATAAPAGGTAAPGTVATPAGGAAGQ